MIRHLLFTTFFFAPLAFAVQPPSAATSSVSSQSPEEKMQSDAAAAAVRYVVALPLVVENTSISDRVRSITINDHGRRCVVEVTYPVF